MIRNKFSLLASAAVAAVLMQDTVGDVSGTGTATAAAPAPAPAAPNDFVTMQEQTFHFKKEKIRDAEGKEVGEGRKLPAAKLYLPLPKTDRLVQILQGGEEFAKERELLLGAVNDVIYAQARAQINAFREADANKDTPITAAVLNYDKLDWTAIANMPKGERGTSVPSDEDIKTFLDSYLEVMPEATGKDKSKIENHVALFQSRFKKQRSQKELLEVFQSALGIYAGAVSDEVLEDNMAVVEYFSNMLARYLKSEEKITMEDI